MGATMAPLPFPQWATRLTLLAVFAIGGCATAAQRQAQQANTATREAAAQVQACVAAIFAKPEYASLVPHTPNLATGQHTMAQLTNESFISPEDAKLFSARYDESSGCRTRFLNAMSAARPDLVPILAGTYTKGAALVVRLVERKDTWGESARQSDAVLSDEREKLAAADHQWIADLNAANQAEMAQRQAAAGVLLQWSAQQQMINAATRPIVTNCNRLGSSVNCTSY
jgi:hypothetical protein